MENMTIVESIIALGVGFLIASILAFMIYSMLIKPFEDKKKKLH